MIYSTADTIALHLGVIPARLANVARSIGRRHDGASLDVAGDGWNVWAEPVGTDGNDPTTLHVRVRLPRATSDDQVAATVTHLYGSGLLTVAADGWQTVAAASCWEDWSEEAGGLVWVREGKALGMRRYEEPTDN